MDCLDNCKHGALKLQSRLKKNTSASSSTLQQENSQGEHVDASRRSILTATTLLAATSALKAQEKKVDGGLAVIEDKEVPKRATSIVPAGAWSAHHFAKHCTACQLCVSECPNDVLHPSTNVEKLMQPEMSYERGYCRPECTRCSEVCPVGAIKPITMSEKSSTRIGHAVWVKKNCIPIKDGVSCGNCARHCPSGAILMVAANPDDEESVKNR